MITKSSPHDKTGLMFKAKVSDWNARVGLKESFYLKEPLDWKEPEDWILLLGWILSLDLDDVRLSLCRFSVSVTLVHKFQCLVSFLSVTLSSWRRFLLPCRCSLRCSTTRKNERSSFKSCRFLFLISPWER